MRYRNAWTVLVMLVVVTALSVYLRTRGLAATSSLGDAIHPWWAAQRGGWPRAHAAPYGWGLVVPYWLASLGADSLWTAVSRMLTWHALVAPIAAIGAWRLGGRSMLTGACAGLLVAVDPGLIDTALSGAEGYLGGVWVGCMTLAVLWRDKAWSPVMAGMSLSMAVMNHPLAACTGVLLFGLRLGDRRTWIGLLAGLGLCLPHVVRLLGEAMTGGGLLGPPAEALPAYIDQGGAVAWLLLLGPVVGVFDRRTRGLAVATLVAGCLLAGLGAELGYLRDHHYRLLTVPAVLGWSRVGVWCALGCLLFVRLPPHPVFPAGHVDRPGTMGLAHLLSDRIAQEAPPLVVDGAWLAGGPATAPSAVMLDLHLRGWEASDLMPGGRVVVLVSTDRAGMGQWPGGLALLEQGDRHALLVGTEGAVLEWSERLCAAREEAGDAPPRLGGAWEAMSALHPHLSTEAARAWWACPERSDTLPE